MKDSTKNLMWSTLIKVGIMLIWERINSDKDSSSIKAELVNAKTPDEVEAIAVREAEDYLGDVIGDENVEIITDLVRADDESAVAEVLNRPQSQRSIIQGIGDLVKGILRAIFGGK